jgi:hypothetical protein
MSSIYRFSVFLAFMWFCMPDASGQATISAGTTRNFNPVPPSPEAAAFQKYGDIPVSYNTGVPQINIPIYTIALNGFLRTLDKFR